MKILVVSNMYPSKAAPSYGVFVKNFCDQLTELGHSYDLAVMCKASGKAGKLLNYIRFYSGSFLKSLFGKYDLVYVHYASHSSPGVLLARKLRKFPIFTNCHGSDVIPQNSGQESMQKFTRQILAKSQRIVVPSEFFRRTVAEKYGIAEDRLAVCPSGGINTDTFYPSPKEADRPFTIGFVSRLTPGKGWDTLLQACTELTDYQLILVGDGPERKAMEETVQNLGISAQLHPLLPQQQLQAIYSQLDAFVFPTRLQESLGLVAIEAMACGAPVIASDFAAPADYVKDGINGYKFPVGDAHELAAQLQKLQALSSAEQAQLRQGALETASRYTREAATQTLKNILTL